MHKSGLHKGLPYSGFIVTHSCIKGAKFTQDKHRLQGINAQSHATVRHSLGPSSIKHAWRSPRGLNFRSLALVPNNPSLMDTVTKGTE